MCLVVDTVQLTQAQVQISTEEMVQVTFFPLAKSAQPALPTEGCCYNSTKLDVLVCNLCNIIALTNVEW